MWGNRKKTDLSVCERTSLKEKVFTLLLYSGMKGMSSEKSEKDEFRSSVYTERRQAEKESKQ